MVGENPDREGTAQFLLQQEERREGSGVCRSVVLMLEFASESPGGLIIKEVTGLTPEFLIQ